MKKSKEVILSLAILSTLFLISFISASITVNAPTSGQAVNGTFLFNVTTDMSKPLNCSFATTSDGIFAWTVNDTASDTQFTNSTNTATLTEILATTLTVNCYNSSGSQQATQTFDIDNTAPTCSFIIDLIKTNRLSGLGITTTDYSSDTTTLTYLYNLTNEDGTQKQTYTTQTSTFSDGDLEDLGEHTITLTVTDEVSKSSSCTQNFFVKNDDTDKDVAVQITEKKSRGALLWIILGAIIIIIFSIVIWFTLEGSKK